MFERDDGELRATNQNSKQIPVAGRALGLWGSGAKARQIQSNPGANHERDGGRILIRPGGHTTSNGKRPQKWNHSETKDTKKPKNHDITGNMAERERERKVRGGKRMGGER